jgi:hypothetical protein
MRRVIFTVLGIVVLAGVIAGACVAWDWTTHRVTLYNAATGEVTDVELILDGFGENVLHEQVGNLRSGDSASFHLTENDLIGEIRFKLRGDQHERQIEMDLWTGEDWLITINDRGEVESSYDD